MATRQFNSFARVQTALAMLTTTRAGLAGLVGCHSAAGALTFGLLRRQAHPDHDPQTEVKLNVAGKKFAPRGCKKSQWRCVLRGYRVRGSCELGVGAVHWGAA